MSSRKQANLKNHSLVIFIFLVCKALFTLAHSQVDNDRCLLLEAYNAPTKTMLQTYNVVAERLRLLEIKGANLLPLQGKRIEIHLQNISSEAYTKLSKSLQTRGNLAFQLVKSHAANKAAQDLTTDDLEEIAFTNDLLASVKAKIDYLGYGGSLLFDIKKSYQGDFVDFTSSHIGQRLAMVLDGKVLIAPMLQGAISDSGQISGLSDLAEAEAIAAALLSGYLPTPLKITDSNCSYP